MSFADLGLLPALVDALATLGIHEPTPVQRIAVPAVAGGASVIVVARTGSGKTLAYGAPVLQRLRGVEDAEGAVTRAGAPRALVLTSTRELVDQGVRALKSIGHGVRQRVRGVAGGQPIAAQRKVLGEAFDVLFANPPRLAALVRERLVQLDDVRICVVDEADTLLSPGQRPEVEALLAALPRAAARVYVSATLPEPIRAWLLTRPEHPRLLLSKDAHTAPEHVDVRNLRVKGPDRADAAHDVLVEIGRERRGVIFTNRRETADAAAAALRERGHDVLVAHGGLDPLPRRDAIRAFKAGRGRLLVTTELAGRGLHVDGLDFVLNWELPERASDYVHRVGRVGRQNAPGLVVNLVGPSDVHLLAAVERLARGGRLDTGEPLRHARTRVAKADRPTSRRGAARRR